MQLNFISFSCHKVHQNAEGPSAGKSKQSEVATDKDTNEIAPPVAVPLPNESCYYLLDDFNHHHQHSVLAGSTHRFASTHRVSRTEGHTFQYIKSKCDSTLQGSGGTNSLSIKQVRAEQRVMNELEFEWIRQYFIQGQLHHDLHEWWHEPIQVLLGLWENFQIHTVKALEALQDNAEGRLAEGVEHCSRKKLAKRRKRASQVSESGEELYDVMIEFLEERYIKREGWLEREKDPIFSTLDRNFRPLPVILPSINSVTSSATHDNDKLEVQETETGTPQYQQMELMKTIDAVKKWKMMMQSHDT